MAIRFPRTHERELKFVRGTDPLSSDEGYIGPKRIGEIEAAVYQVAKQLYCKSEFLFSGGIGIALTLRSIDEELKRDGGDIRDILPSNVLSRMSNVVNGFYRDHRAVHVCAFEEGLTELVGAARAHFYALCKRGIMAKVAGRWEVQNPNFISVTEAPVKKNLRFMRTVKIADGSQKILTPRNILDYIDLYLHHYEAFDEGKEKHVRVEKKDDSTFRVPGESRPFLESQVDIVSNDDGIRLPMDSYRGRMIEKGNSFVIRAVHPIYSYLIKVRQAGKSERDDFDLEVLEGILGHLGLLEHAKDLLRPKV